MRDPSDNDWRDRDFTRSAKGPSDTDPDDWGFDLPADPDWPLGPARSAKPSRSSDPAPTTGPTRAAESPRTTGSPRSTEPAWPDETSRATGSYGSTEAARPAQPTQSKRPLQPSRPVQPLRGALPARAAQPTRVVRSTRPARPRRRRRLRSPKWFRTLLAGYRHIPRFVRWPVVALLALIVLSMMVDAGLYSNKIHAGVSIAGQDMAGMTADEATAALTRVAEEARSKAITLTSDQKTWDVLPDSVGLEIDVAGSVSTAMNVTRESNVFVDMARKLKLYFSGQDIPLEGTLNSAEFDAVIDEVTEELDVPAVNAGFAIQGITLTEIEGQDGIVVDRDALREQLTETLLTLHSTEISIPMVVVEPEVKAEEYEAALAQTKTMIGAPLTLTSDEDSWTFSAGQVTGFVDFKSEESNDVSTLVPYISAKKMDKVLDRLEDLVATEPIDASFQGDDEKAWVVPAVPGAKLDREATTEALNAAALKSTGRTAEVVVKQVNAKFTTEEAEAMGIKDLLSVRTTEWTGTSNRRNNVRITTEFINADGKCYVAPGEEFSTAEAIGPRTPERGYKLAPGIQPNGALDDVFGGGICQVATTLFNAVFFAGLEVTERRNHTIYISHYPEGRDAAIAGDEVDLKFVNDTDHYIWIKGESTGFRTTFSIYGTDDGRRVTFKDSGILDEGPPPEVVTSLVRWLDPGATVVTSPGQPYRVVIVTRWITWPNGTKKEEKFTSIYPVRPMIILVGPATTTTTTLAPPPPTTSTT